MNQEIKKAEELELMQGSLEKEINSHNMVLQYYEDQFKENSSYKDFPSFPQNIMSLIEANSKFNFK